jgi:hypothetical protein
MPAGIGAGYMAYAHHSDRAKMTFHTGIQFMNYGKFDAANEQGIVSGSFNAQEIALAIGAAKQLSERWSLGVNTKFIFSNLENYTASGLSTDVAATHDNPEKRSTFAIIAKNIGVQMTTFSATSGRSPLPFEIQMGYSKRLKHLPFRYSIIARDLQRWNIRYDDPNKKETNNILGEPEKETPNWVKNTDNLARHLIINGEFLLGKKETIRLRFGYNHLTKREMNVPPFRTLSGFSFGFGVKIKRLSIDFGRNNLHQAGGFNQFTFATQIGKK